MSKSAIRAAKALANGGWIPSRSASRVPQIIEEETGLQELLEARKMALRERGYETCPCLVCSSLRASIAQAEGR